ncbi:MAG TPA: hypothetical protein VIC84_18255 [Blastocatellia bacterium]
MLPLSSLAPTVTGKAPLWLPEDLVLSETFSNAFASEGVGFDQRDGSFNIHRRAAIDEIEVSGDEMRAY